jgi:short-subunit dehydrogenase
MADSSGAFRGKTVLVTGASLGVGRATAHAFHREGGNVVLLARDRGALAAAAQGLTRALIVPADVADLNAVEGALRATVERFGGLDGLVNNAGLHHRSRVDKRTPEELAAMVDVNLRAPIVLSRMALPLLARRGGFVVNVASLAGKVPLDGAATYSATKFGLRAFTYALAEELRGSGITVSAVSPGPVSTGFIMDKLDEVENVVFSQTLCSAEDVAAMILACARDGRVERQFPVGGGRMATLGYLFPSLRRMMKPLLERKGARVKARLSRERDLGDT